MLSQLGYLNHATLATILRGSPAYRLCKFVNCHYPLSALTFSRFCLSIAWCCLMVSGENVICPAIDANRLGYLLDAPVISSSVIDCSSHSIAAGRSSE